MIIQNEKPTLEKKPMHKTETKGRPETIINKDISKHSLSIRLKNTEIDKTFNVDRMLVARWIKFHQLTNVLSEPEDSDEITKALREAKQFNPSVGCRCAVGHLRVKHEI